MSAEGSIERMRPGDTHAVISAAAALQTTGRSHVQYERKQYKPGMLLVADGGPVYEGADIVKGLNPTAEYLAALRASTAAMAAQNEKLKAVQKAIRDYRSELFWHRQFNEF
jgi:hypothetical protein